MSFKKYFCVVSLCLIASFCRVSDAQVTRGAGTGEFAGKHLFPSELAARRQLQLERVAAYAAAGIFPRNHNRTERTPVFVDASGRLCAVAYLMTQVLYGCVVGWHGHEYSPCNS